MAIDKRYKTSLNNKFNQLWYQGYCTLERWEITSWFGHKERITNVVWREIIETWYEFAESETDYPIQIIRCDNSNSATPTQSFVLVQSSRLNDLSLMAE
jgi:hypothetical protein